MILCMSLLQRPAEVEGHVPASLSAIECEAPAVTVKNASGQHSLTPDFAIVGHVVMPLMASAGGYDLGSDCRQDSGHDRCYITGSPSSNCFITEKYFSVFGRLSGLMRLNL